MGGALKYIDFLEEKHTLCSTFVLLLEVSKRRSLEVQYLSQGQRK